MENPYEELVEVLENPKISEKKYTALIAANTRMKLALKKPPKKKRGKSKKPRLDPMMIAVGAAAVTAADIYVVQSGPVATNIPKNVRRWSGLLWAAIGFMLMRMKGKKNKTTQSIYAGMIAGGLSIQAFKEIMRQKGEDLDAAIEKAFGTEAAAAVAGIGLWPDAPEVYPRHVPGGGQHLGVLDLHYPANGGQGFGELQWGSPPQALGAAWDAGTLGDGDYEAEW